MAFEQTENGLAIQSLAEIVAEFQADMRDPVTGWGAGAQVAANTALGQLAGIFAERIALLQQQSQDTQSGFDSDAADNVELDTIAKLTATFRRGADKSESTSGLITGTNGTNVPDLSRVRNTGTSEVWEVVGGPYAIPVSGFISCTIRAEETGPKEFLAGTLWEIVDSTPGWDFFSSTADIDPEDVGRDNESDEALRQRRNDELYSGGNDLSGIKAAVSKVVDEVAVYENRSCAGFDADGIPPGAIEVVVEGGVSADIVAAIYERKPPGTETFGTVIGSISDTEGNPITIGFTRVADVDVWMSVIVGVGDAEVNLPDNVATLVADAILDFGNSNAAIGQDVLPETFSRAIWAVLEDPETGKYSAETLLIKAGLSEFATAVTPISIDIRSRADYDTLRIAVAIP